MQHSKEIEDAREDRALLEEPRREYRKPAIEEEDVFTFYTLRCKWSFEGCDNDPAKTS